MSFSEILQRHRKEHHLSQRKLAKVLNISSQQISKYERGIDMPSGEVLLRIAAYFNISAGALLDDSFERNKNLYPDCPSQLTFADILKLLRTQSGNDIEDIAKRLQISTAILLEYESGSTPKIEHFFQLAKHYNVSLDFLAGLCPDPDYAWLKQRVISMAVKDAIMHDKDYFFFCKKKYVRTDADIFTEVSSDSPAF